MLSFKRSAHEERAVNGISRTRVGLRRGGHRSRTDLEVVAVFGLGHLGVPRLAFKVAGAAVKLALPALGGEDVVEAREVVDADRALDACTRARVDCGLGRGLGRGLGHG